MLKTLWERLAGGRQVENLNFQICKMGSFQPTLLVVIPKAYNAFHPCTSHRVTQILKSTFLYLQGLV